MKKDAHFHSVTATQVDQEHEELRELLGAIHKSLTTDNPSPAQVREQLVVLCNNLESHFQTEENAGFFTEITEKAPRLCNQADKLTHEHESMLEEARALTNLALRCTEPESLSNEVLPMFHEFSKHLMHHESEENEMMQKAYWDDIGSGD